MSGSESHSSAQLGVSTAKHPFPREELWCGWVGAGGGRKERKAGCGGPEGSRPPGSQWKLQSRAQDIVLDGGTELALAQELSGTAVPCHGNPGVDRSPGQHRLGEKRPSMRPGNGNTER